MSRSPRLSDRSDPLRVPDSQRPTVDAIFRLTDPFCAEHLDDEYAFLVRKLIAKLSRKRPSPLARGKLEIWAAAAIYTVGSINFLFDRTQDPHLTGDDISRLTGVPKSTLAAKAKVILTALHLGQLDPEFSRQALLARPPLAWIISLGGVVVNGRRFRRRSRRRRGRLGMIRLPPQSPERTDSSEEPAE